jgi:hypothetical protein
MNSIRGTLSIGNADASRVMLAGGAFVLVAAAALAGFAPISFSIATVFLFAGPHNWIEARYFFARLPARWGRLSGYFTFAFAGVFGLTAFFASLPWMASAGAWDQERWDTALALWGSAVVIWIALLIQMRSRQNPRREWSWTMPVAFLAIAGAWLAPALWALGLVYAHPLMALWIFDRELTRRHVPWRGAYRACVACVPLFLIILWARLANAPHLAGDDALRFRIADHAGATILPNVSSHLLVATHTFLEMVHYAIWLIAIPLVGIAGAPWKLHAIPLARRSPSWRTVVAVTLALGSFAVIVLWAAFLVDYPLTRDIYFTVALLHVLAEVPFLLRAL